MRRSDEGVAGGTENELERRRVRDYARREDLGNGAERGIATVVENHSHRNGH